LQDVAPPLTLTVIEPEDAKNAGLPSYDAAIKLPPLDNWLPLTVRLAVALPPDPDSVPEPSAVSPTAKDTDPAGDVVPEVARTVAVSTVLPPGARLAGFATTAVAVAPARLAAH
jgi:hypothetical protein